MNRRRFLGFLLVAPVAVPAALKAVAATPLSLPVTSGVVTPVPFEAMEGLIMWDAAVIPLLAAKMDDAGDALIRYAP